MPPPPQEWGGIIQVVSERLEEVRGQYDAVIEKLGKMEVAFERLSVFMERLPELQQKIDGKVDQVYLYQAQETQKERDVRQDTQIRACSAIITRAR